MSKFLRILIVEDSEDDAILLKHALSRGGYDVASAVVDTPAAMRLLLQNQEWDIITSDHAMPDFSAPEALALAKELRPEVPFIIVSGEIDLNLAVSLMRGGAQDYIQKREMVRVVPVIERELREVALHREQQRGDAARKETELKYRSLIESLNGVIFCVDEKGQYQFANQAFASTFGKTPDYFIGKTFRDIYPQEDADRRFEIIKKVFQSGKSDSFEISVPLPDKTLYFHSTTSPIKDETGNVILAVTHSTDITDQKRVDAERETLLEIMQGFAVTNDLHEILAIVHRSVAKVIHAVNFFVVFYNNTTGLFEEVYTVDQRDLPAPPSRLEKSTTAYIYRTGEALIITAQNFRALEALGEVHLVGTRSASWMGIPLKTLEGTIGVIVVQDYEIPDLYTEDDKNFMVHIGTQVALAIERKQAEGALIVSESRFKTIFDQAPLGMALTNSLTGEIFSVNSTFAKIVNRTVKELTHTDWTTITHPDDLQKNLDQMALVNAGKINGFQMDKRFLHQNGDIVWVNMTIARMNGEDEANPCHLCMIEDITERKRTEAALRESDAKHRRMIANISDVIAIMDRDGILRYESPNIEKWFGWQAEDLVGSSGWDTVLPDDLERIRTVYLRLLEKDRAEKMAEFRFKCKNGSYKWINLTAVNLSNDPLINGILMNYRDISERKLLEEAQRLSEEKFTTAFQTSPDSININRLNDGLYIEINQGFSALTGYTPDEVVGKTSLELDIWVNPEDRKRLVKGLRDHSEVKNLEAPFRCKNGEIKTCLMSARIINFNQEICILSITRDITERKRAEEQIQLLNTELEQRVTDRTAQLTAANQELEAFSYSVSHDLRAPLRIMDGYTKILVEDYASQLDGEGNLYLTRIQDASQRMGHLINDMLNLSRVTQTQFTRQRVDLGALARQVAAELKTQDPQRLVSFDIAPDIVVEGDADLLRIALENLLGNAYKFTSRRKKAAIQVGKFEQEGTPVYFVRDNGAGFDKNDTGKLFRAFQRLHSDKDFPGTGIGLATVKRIINCHGGSIWAEGVVDGGATFYFTLA